jgi:hypothetical protein
MPRYNPARKAAHVRQKKQAQLEEELAENGK